MCVCVYVCKTVNLFPVFVNWSMCRVFLKCIFKNIYFIGLNEEDEEEDEKKWIIKIFFVTTTKNFMVFFTFYFIYLFFFFEK